MNKVQRVFFIIYMLGLFRLNASDLVEASSLVRFNVKHIEAGGVGYRTGYSTLSAFVMPYRTDCELHPFCDLRWHYTDDHKNAGNFGLGARYMYEPLNLIVGTNLYYDFRNEHKRNFQQVGIGLEALGEVWDFRLNGYLPVGNKRSSHYDKKVTRWLNLPLLLHKSKVDIALGGADFEIGRNLWQCGCFNLYGAIGPYFYLSMKESKNFAGAQARIEANFMQYFSLELKTSYDRVFQSTFQGQISINAPVSWTWNFTTDCPQNTGMSKLFADVHRQELIALKRHRKKHEKLEFLKAVAKTRRIEEMPMNTANTGSESKAFSDELNNKINSGSTIVNNEIAPGLSGEQDNNLNSEELVRNPEQPSEVSPETPQVTPPEPPAEEKNWWEFWKTKKNNK